jgi:competence protein ComEC
VDWLDGSARAQIGELSLLIAAPAWFEGIEANEASLFVRVDVGGASLAMTGDANSTVEGTMSSVADWDVDLLKAGHHGSRHSTSSEWLEETSPSFVVVSCGRRNPYGHPAVQMQQRVREHGSRLMRTDRDGTIVFVPRGDEFVLAQTYR